VDLVREIGESDPARQPLLHDRSSCARRAVARSRPSIAVPVRVDIGLDVPAVAV